MAKTRYVEFIIERLFIINCLVVAILDGLNEICFSQHSIKSLTDFASITESFNVCKACLNCAYQKAAFKFLLHIFYVVCPAIQHIVYIRGQPSKHVYWDRLNWFEASLPSKKINALKRKYTKNGCRDILHFALKTTCVPHIGNMCLNFCLNLKTCLPHFRGTHRFV